jgi:hypothetical protein
VPIKYNIIGHNSTHHKLDFLNKRHIVGADVPGEGQMPTNLSELEFTDDSTLPLLKAGGITTVEQLEATTCEDLLALDSSGERFDPLNLVDLVMALENAGIELPQFSLAEAA